MVAITLRVNLRGEKITRRYRAESTISTFLPIKLSIIRLPQSMRALCMTMLFSISVFWMVEPSPMRVYGPM
jgi:hypothetical protein